MNGRKRFSGVDSGDVGVFPWRCRFGGPAFQPLVGPVVVNTLPDPQPNPQPLGGLGSLFGQGEPRPMGFPYPYKGGGSIDG